MRYFLTILTIVTWFAAGLLTVRALDILDSQIAQHERV